MSNYNQLFESEWMQALGWTLLHSLWQGVVIALLLAGALLLLRKHSANIRYLTGIVGLSGLLTVMALTFFMTYTPAPEIEPVKDSVETEFYGLAELEAVVFEAESAASPGEATTISSVFINYFEEHMPFIMLLYLIGVLILTMRLLGELVYIQNLRYSRSQDVSEVWQKKLKNMAGKMGISKNIALKESLQVNSPMIIGFLKPIIFIPIGLLANLPTNQVESILAHELAHVRRHDYLINLLQSFVEIVLFFNPAVWWISAFIRSEREHCCDDVAIELTGDKLTFARTLANLEEWRMQNARLAVAFAGNRNGGVLGRIQRLVEKKESTQLPFRLFWSATILSLGLIFTAINVNSATAFQNESPEPFETNDFEMPASISNEQTDIEEPDSPASDLEESELATHDLIEEAIIEPNYDETDEPDNAPVEQIISDTVPEKIKHLRREMKEIERSKRLQKDAISKEIMAQMAKKQAVEKEMQRQELELQTAQLNLQKAVQMMEKEKMALERETERLRNEQEGKIMDLQFRMEELELLNEMKQQELSEKENDEKIEAEIAATKKEIQELQKAIMSERQAINRKEMDIRKQSFSKDSEIQEILFKAQMLEHESQMNMHSKEVKMLEIESAVQQIQNKMHEQEQQLRLTINQLERKLEMEYEKLEQEEF